METKTAIKNLNKLTDKTGAKLVIISYCKNEIRYDKLKKMLIDAGVTGDIHGKTINIDKHLRQEQIANYLANHKIKNFIVLDDKPYDYADNEHTKASWIQPKHHVGLTDDEVKKAIELLKPKE